MSRTAKYASSSSVKVIWENQANQKEKPYVKNFLRELFPFDRLGILQNYPQKLALFWPTWRYIEEYSLMATYKNYRQRLSWRSFFEDRLFMEWSLMITLRWSFSIDRSFELGGESAKRKEAFWKIPFGDRSAMHSPKIYHEDRTLKIDLSRTGPSHQDEKTISEKIFEDLSLLTSKVFFSIQLDTRDLRRGKTRPPSRRGVLSRGITSPAPRKRTRGPREPVFCASVFYPSIHALTFTKFGKLVSQNRSCSKPNRLIASRLDRSRSKERMDNWNIMSNVRACSEIVMFGLRSVYSWIHALTNQLYSPTILQTVARKVWFLTQNRFRWFSPP